MNVVRSVIPTRLTEHRKIPPPHHTPRPRHDPLNLPRYSLRFVLLVGELEEGGGETGGVGGVEGLGDAGGVW